MLPIASAKRAARLTVDGKDVTKKVAFKGDLVTFGLSDEARETDTLKTVVRCSDLQPGQKLNGHIVDLQTGERRGPSASEKRMYLMPWGDALIGVLTTPLPWRGSTTTGTCAPSVHRWMRSR